MTDIGAFLIGVGLGFFLVGCVYAVARYLAWQKARSKFDAFVKTVKAEGDKLAHKEISELTFRDKDGVLNTVRIIIDHNLEITEEDKVKAKAVLAGENVPDMKAGKLSELVSSDEMTRDMEGVKEFVFSAQAVQDMRRDGLEPDEVVTRMLKASGRMN